MMTLGRSFAAIVVVASVGSSPAFAGPGDPDTPEEHKVRERWRTIPHECADATLGEEQAKRKAEQGAATITGAGPALSPGEIDRKVFSKYRQYLPKMTPDLWLERLACGHDVRGIEPDP